MSTIAGALLPYLCPLSTRTPDLLSYAPLERDAVQPDPLAIAMLPLWNASRSRFSSNVDLRERARSRVCTDGFSGRRSPRCCTHGTRRGADAQRQPTVARQ